MTIKAHWFLPTAGDSRDIVPSGPRGHSRPASAQYLTQIAQAAESLRFHSVLTPAGTWCEEPWVTTASLLPLTSRLKFLVAFRPGLVTPTLAAQQAATFQRISGGRLLINIVTGGQDVEQRRYGDWLQKAERYERTEEFIAIMRGVWSGEPFTLQGEHFDVAGATGHTPPDPVPEIYFGGASPSAERVAARQADVYLTWGEPPEATRERVLRMRELAAREGRELRFGIRLHAIARERSRDAWGETRRLLDVIEPATIAAMQRALEQDQSVAQKRMTELHGGRIDNLVVAPNLWAGVGLVRAGAGTALVGSYEEVAERIAEYHEIGFEHFIMSGHPHLEEAYEFGEGVLPLLRRAGLLEDPDERAAVPAAPAAQQGPSYIPTPAAAS